MAKLLLADDDFELVRGLSRYLNSQGYVVETALTGGDALQMLSGFSFEIVILDWQLGDMTGVEVLRQYRSSGGKAPVLMLTGLSDLDSKEAGLDAGADDYLTKPFEVRELSARLRSLLRRPAHLISTDMEADGVNLEIETRTVSNGNQSVRLSKREAALLEFLLRHKDRHFSSAQIRDNVWPLDSEGSEDTVRTCIRTLRQKLSRIGRADLIRTDLKCGYIIDA
ncbi:MAG: response regulator transcription factor [Cyanobacteria bacterium HKST-UBA02]|nr:response regulator transcription factor [Cyanobacteria bacterium HKST-UBA02]